jgi:hypothetical protein
MARANTTTAESKPLLDNPNLPSQGGEEVIDVADLMRQRVENSIPEIKERSRNPLIPNNPFDSVSENLPKQYEYVPVQIPGIMGPQFKLREDQILREFLSTGWLFLTTDLVSRDGRNGRAILDVYEERDGKVVINNCYILYASKDWFNKYREEKVKDSNAKSDRSIEAMKEAAEVKQDGNMRIKVIDNQVKGNASPNELERQLDNLDRESMAEFLSEGKS